MDDDSVSNQAGPQGAEYINSLNPPKSWLNRPVFERLTNKRMLLMFAVSFPIALILTYFDTSQFYQFHFPRKHTSMAATTNVWPIVPVKTETNGNTISFFPASISEVIVVFRTTNYTK